MQTSSSSHPSSSSSNSNSSVALTHTNYGILPQLLDGDYSTLCNKNGRIGIYTKEERVSIISRFQDKRRNRVWKKKIRYHCRKNLADRRVRIKVSE
jgi:CCT motif